MAVAIQNSLDGIADALYGIAESLDYLAATSENEAPIAPTERDLAIISALKKDFNNLFFIVATIGDFYHE